MEGAVSDLMTLCYETVGALGSYHYLDDFLSDLPGLVDVQWVLGVPHDGVERPAFAEAGVQEVSASMSVAPSP